MNEFKYAITFLILMLTGPVFAHGEEKLGPNGGYIRMPGPFHTELLPAGINAFKIYLLDMEWKNPSVKNSSVALSFGRNSSLKSDCTIQKHFYICTFRQKMHINHGELRLEATRENQRGNVAKYMLPLTLEPQYHAQPLPTLPITTSKQDFMQ